MRLYDPAEALRIPDGTPFLVSDADLARMRYLASRHPLPTADDIASTLVLAAMRTDERETLKARAPAALSGHVRLRARWYAFDALLQFRPRCDPRALSQLIGCHGTGHGDPLVALAYMRQHTWFDRDTVSALVSFLHACSGRPRTPVAH